MNLMTAFRQENLDLNNIMKQNQKEKNTTSCSESDQQYSSKKNLDLNNINYEIELERKEYKFLL